MPRLPPLREQVEEEEMEIAWRYQNLPKVQVCRGGDTYTHRYGKEVTHTCTYPRTHTHTYMHAHTHTHTYIRARTHTHTQSSFSNRFGHFFDLTTNMDPARVEAVDKVLFDATDNPARYHILRLCLFV